MRWFKRDTTSVVPEAAESEAKAAAERIRRAAEEFNKAVDDAAGRFGLRTTVQFTQFDGNSGRPRLHVGEITRSGPTEIF